MIFEGSAKRTADTLNLICKGSQKTKATIPCGASKHGIFSYSDSTYSASATLRASKHVIFHEKYSDSCPSTEYRRRNIDGDIMCFDYHKVGRNTYSSRKTEYEPSLIPDINLPGQNLMFEKHFMKL